MVDGINREEDGGRGRIVLPIVGHEGKTIAPGKTCVWLVNQIGCIAVQRPVGWLTQNLEGQRIAGGIGCRQGDIEQSVFDGAQTLRLGHGRSSSRSRHGYRNGGWRGIHIAVIDHEGKTVGAGKTGIGLVN